ncbi:acetylxylan esterase precursor [Rhypophila decipiens]|uniref:Acetylxylan esterase n=1 Tax=Rhypophila decipiens TaxID=261697 RepID=A0AAN6Y607_9PEZI|nr:acetylxylan esterase precursor [Rhypophila decipiens]
MHKTSLLSIAVSVAAPLVTAQQCNKIQIFTAVGHGENYPGVQQSITRAVCHGLSGCGVANIQYPSTVSGDGCRAIETGIAYGRTALTDYVTKCPESKIVVMGWSQGASVVGDLLAGGGGPGKGAMAGCTQKTTPPMDPTTAPGSHIVAIAFYGNPRHNANQKFNVGTGSGIDGVMARPADNLAVLQTWGDRLQDYCAMGDVACNAGRDGGAHSSYFSNSYASIPAKWIRSKLGV